MTTVQNKLQPGNNDGLKAVTSLFNNVNVKARFEQMLGKRADQFIASVMNLARNNTDLSEAVPMTILNSAATAAALDLPIDPNLGFAYVIPYKNKGVTEAQFQMGAKGYVQLALRSGQYTRMTVNEVYEGEITKFNRFTGEMEYGERTGNEVIGYLAYFKLVNGGEQYLYWTKEQVLNHAKNYSAAYKSKYGPSGPWKDNFDEMAKKTVLKTLLRKYGILSIEMQQMRKAIEVDQAVIGDGEQMSYPDGFDQGNEMPTIDISASKEPEQEQLEEPKELNPADGIFGEEN